VHSHEDVLAVADLTHPKTGVFVDVEKVLKATEELFDTLEVQGPPRDRDEEKRKAQERGIKRDAQLRKRLLATPA
jgi:hypothetical protein